jgi:signal transduction histidine kinase
VQDLAGVSYTLSAASDEIEPLDAEMAATLDQTSRQTRESIRALRTLLVDIYPPRLHSEGLVAAISDLLSGLSAAGIEATLDADPQLRLAPKVEGVLFRAAQECLRNVLEHAGAAQVTVRVREELNHRIALEVEDDGHGFDPSAHAGDEHFGLRMLGDLARDNGGTLVIDSAAGRGTTMRLEVPAE